ncbi:MAG: GNAT family N-acetyltransferase [SAR202 cluster bacterium]|jgi:predicted acetyltransferase|nr:GNAT family N-acetyltransferase [SAR202 cluster bacterium]MDP6512338.1 GNAT family N-acetyltransferase [SAR202 cluster bacterium]
MTESTSMEYGPVQPEETQPLWKMIDQALHRSMQPGWAEHVGQENFRAMRVNGKLAGGMGIMNMGQWFGGRTIPTAGVTAVGVAPEFRGGGAASALLKSALEEIHESGTPLSTLFPSTLTVYRRSGYERAGVRMVYQLPTQEINVRSRDLDIVEADESHREDIFLTYNARAEVTSGNLDRPALMWDPILGFGGRQVFTYLITNNGETEGYAIFQQSRGANHIRVRDLCVLTQGAALRLLRFFADHRSTIDTVSWNGAPADPLVHLLGEQIAQPTVTTDWVLRIIDVQAALSQRGYPRNYEGDLHISVDDDLLPWNDGNFVLKVAAGRGEVYKGGRGDLKIGIRGLASLFSGHLTPSEIKTFGGLEGADTAMADATAMFASPRPWMADHF